MTTEIESPMTKTNDRQIRRKNTYKKINKRKKLLHQLGFAGGLIYERHVEKVKKSYGYMKDGSLAHYAITKPPKKTNKRNRYGKIYNPPKKDKIQIDRMNYDDEV